jgi:hypothetical protein
MLKYGDDQGFMDYDKLDREVPGWDDRLPSRKFIKTQVNAHRSTGLFKVHKRQVAGTAAPETGALRGEGRAPAVEHARLGPKSSQVVERSERLLKLMWEYGNQDKREFVAWACQKDPTLQNEYKSLKHLGAAATYLRMSGKFLKYKKGRMQQAEPASNAPGGAATIPQADKVFMTDAAEIDRMVRERVAEQMQVFVAETRFCSRCGKDRLPQVRAEMLTTKLQS